MHIIYDVWNTFSRDAFQYLTYFTSLSCYLSNFSYDFMTKIKLVHYQMYIIVLFFVVFINCEN